MSKTRTFTALCLAAVLTLLCAPAAFAGHGRDGWRHGGYHGHAGRYHGAARYHDRDRHFREARYYRGGHRYYRGGRYVYDNDGFGRWVAGALVVGALTNLVVDVTQPPPPVYTRTRVIVREAPPVRYVSDPYQTRYIGREDDDDD